MHQFMNIRIQILLAVLLSCCYKAYWLSWDFSLLSGHYRSCSDSIYNEETSRRRKTFCWSCFCAKAGKEISTVRKQWISR